jgi:hypothetical protein
MSGALSRLNDCKNYYVNNFPTDVLTKAAQGFTASTILRATFDGVIRKGPFNVNEALLTGAMAATATVIEAVSRPIIKMFLPKSFQSYGLICYSRITTLGLAYLISSRTGVNYAPQLGYLTPFGYLFSFFMVYSWITMVVNSHSPISGFTQRNIATLQLF